MNLEQEIEAWKKSLYKHKSLEEGVIAELEDHLLNDIQRLIGEGLSEQQAFEQAKHKIGSISSVASQEVVAGKIGSRYLTRSLYGNFMKVGGRYLRRNGLTSVINILGLIVAFTAILFIGLFIHDELSYEKHHPDYEQLYRLSYSFQEENGEVEERAFSSGMWADLLVPRNPSITDHFRFLNLSYGYIFNPETEEAFYEEGTYWSDPNFFEFLNFPLKYGNPADQLQNLNSIVLTETTAKKVFGDENPVGRRLKYRRTVNEVDFIVTGVIYDPPSNSHFQPDYIANIQSIQGIYGEQYRGWVDKNPRPGYVFTYLKINDPAAVQVVEADIKTLWDEAIPDISERIEPILTPISSIHFNPPIKWEIDNPIDKSYIYGLAIVGVFVLLIALTNFTNLTTAQGSKRQKEIGLRKTLGSTTYQLRIQFFLESSMMLLASLLASLVIAYLLTPDFNQLIGKNIDFLAAVGSNSFLKVALPVIGLVLFFTGSLPALYFTRKLGKFFSMNQFFLKEKVNSPGRNALVVVQFSVAIILIIGTLTIYNQLALINDGYLGKGRETVVGIRTSRMGDSLQVQRYKTKIESIAGVAATTLGMHLPRQSDFGRINTRYYAVGFGSEPYYWNKFDADGGFLSTYGLKLLAGENFTKNIQPRALIVNEMLVKQLGLTPKEALGKSLREDSINYVFGSSDGTIIGVVEDFAYKSIKEEIEPLVICANNGFGGVLSVKLGEGNKQDVLSQMREEWLEIYPGRPFEYWFLDKEFERLYNQERRLGRLIPLFSGLAIIVALLGLFALTIFTAELRKKEIGIRKVLGCSTLGILRLFGWQFLKTLLPAILISIPVAYVGLNYWLDGFSYRVDVSVITIIVSVSAVLVTSISTISLKSLKAATSNPIDSLRYE